jgi:diacylglycerol kinase (ATP)
MTKSLIIVNPYAGAGYAAQVWDEIATDVQKHFGTTEVALTKTPEDVYRAVHDAAQKKLDYVLSIGGDGTNHIAVNAMMSAQSQYPDHNFTYGMIPAGTGRDWARGVGMPMSPTDAVTYLAQRKPQSIDIGKVDFGDSTEFFLNISSVGISNDIVQRVENANKRRPWTYLKAVVAGILRYDPEPMHIEVDGKLWYEGRIYVVAVANGTTFGQGMMIAPKARYDDGLLDVILIDDATRTELLLALRTVFNGSHLSNPHVHCTRGKEITITSDGRAIGLDLDGEPAHGRTLLYTIQPKAIRMLL